MKNIRGEEIRSSRIRGRVYESNRALEREYKSCEPKRNEEKEWGKAARFFSPSRVRRNDIMGVGEQRIVR